MPSGRCGATSPLVSFVAVDVDGDFFHHLHAALANRMPDPSGVLMRSTITSMYVPCLSCICCVL
jgi:hypothetical protein